MRRMQLIGRIPPGALKPPLQEQRDNCFEVARGEFPGRGAISLIRCIRRIRVEPLNLDGGPMVLNPDAKR
jgi:hypothetical protein